MTRLWSSVFAVLCLLITACDGPDPVPSTGVDPQVVLALFERMDRLIAVLAIEHDAAPAPGPEPSPLVASRNERTPADAGDTAELLRRLEALEQQMQWLRASRSGTAGSRAAFIASMRRTDVERLTEQLNSEDPTVEQQGRAELFLLTIDQVIEQLGMPTNSNLGQDGNIYLEYDLGERDLNLGFKDGRVIYISG